MNTDKAKSLIDDCIILSLRTEVIFRSAEESECEGDSEILRSTGFYFSRELNKKLAALEKVIYSK